MGLEAEDVRLPIHEVFNKYMPQIWDAGTFEQLSEEMLATFEKMEQYIQEFSATLPRSVKGQEVKTARFLKNLRKKMHRVIRHNHPKPFNEIGKLKLQIQPEGMVQERTLGLGSFPEVQPDELIALFWAHIEPLDFSHKIIVLNSSHN
jgi:hypothetical protein